MIDSPHMTVAVKGRESPDAPNRGRLLTLLKSAGSILALCVIVLAVWTVHYWYLTVGTWELWEAPAYSHYVWLSHGFVFGNIDLPVSDLALQAPVADLAKLPDPYEPGTRQRFSVPFDVSYFQGKFYLYFGAVPAVILALVLRFTGFAPVDDSVLVYGGMCGVVAAGAALIWQIRKLLLCQTPGWYPLIIFTLFSFGEATFMLLEKPAVYQATILCGQAFLLWGMVFTLPGWVTGRPRIWGLLVSGGLWSLAWGSRLSLLPTVVLLIAITGIRLASRMREMGIRRTVVSSCALAILPIASVVATGYYNDLRFGSWLESGQRYQLTAYNANAERDHFFDIHYVLPNALMLLTEPVERTASFPFVQLSDELSWPKRFELPEYMLTEAPVVGLLVSTPFVLLALAGAFPLGVRRAEVSELLRHPKSPWSATALTVCFSVITLVSLITVSAQRYTAIRYRGDFLFLLLLLTYLAVGQGMQGSKWLRLLLATSTIALIGVSLGASVLLRLVPFVTTPH